MTKKQLYVLWGALFGLCTVLGFFSIWLGQPAPVVQGLFTAVSVAFFVPPALLLHRARKQKDGDTLRIIRNLAMASLGLTAVVLMLNMVSFMASEHLGDLLFGILAVVSAPMICSGYWVLSLFLWACLMAAAMSLLRK